MTHVLVTLALLAALLSACSHPVHCAPYQFGSGQGCVACHVREHVRIACTSPAPGVGATH